MEQRVIQAAIVNHERNRVILDADGALPPLEFAPDHVSIEGTLDLLGKAALTNVAYVSVDHRIVEDGRTVYQTKPVPAGAEPAVPFRWGDCPQDVTLK